MLYIYLIHYFIVEVLTDLIIEATIKVISEVGSAPDDHIPPVLVTKVTPEI